MTSDDAGRPSFVRERLPRAIDIAAGEYIYTVDDARQLLGPTRSTSCRPMSRVVVALPGSCRSARYVRSASPGPVRALRAVPAL